MEAGRRGARKVTGMDFASGHRARRAAGASVTAEVPTLTGGELVRCNQLHLYSGKLETGHDPAARVLGNLVRAAPVDAAKGAGDRKRAPQARRRKYRGPGQRRQARLAGRAVCFDVKPQASAGEQRLPLPERAPSSEMRPGRRGDFPRDRALRNGPLLDRHHRLSRPRIEYIHHAGFVAGNKNGRAPAVQRHCCYQGGAAAVS